MKRDLFCLSDRYQLHFDVHINLMAIQMNTIKVLYAIQMFPNIHIHRNATKMYGKLRHQFSKQLTTSAYAHTIHINPFQTGNAMERGEIILPR